MTWKKSKNADYLGDWYRVVFELQGKEIFVAYHDIFPRMPDDPKAHYEMLSDEKSKKLMIGLYRTANPNIEDLARTTGLKVDDISARIELFRANGMRQIRIRNAA